MKRLILLFLLIPALAQAYNTSKSKLGAEPEMILGTPKKSFSVISPVSSDRRSQDQAFQDLKKKAQKLGADAVINWKCQSGQSSSGGGILGLRDRMVVNAQCEGIAVRWN